MSRKFFLQLGVLLLCAPLLLGNQGGCDGGPQSASGVTAARAIVKTGSDGLTTEQRNVKQRVEEDNKPGAIKHLYVIAPESGQVILYSTVQGKVTSSGKRLMPKRTEGGDDWFKIELPGGKVIYTREMLEDDGTYGDSNPYIYWYDVRGVYHQHFFTGGQIIHVSAQPIQVKNIVLNLELVANEK